MGSLYIYFCFLFRIAKSLTEKKHILAGGISNFFNKSRQQKNIVPMCIQQNKFKTLNTTTMFSKGGFHRDNWTLEIQSKSDKKMYR